jgi:hypothetical protein
MPLSAANVIQAKTASAGAVDPVTVALDDPTTAGSTVTVEMFGPIAWPGMPAGWEFDATLDVLWCFRYSGGPGGETSWDWSPGFPNDYQWRVTEWDVGLDPVSPFEGWAGNNASGTGVTTVSTGISAPETNRAEVVALAYHHWVRGATTAQAFDWSAHTNGFTERDEARVSFSTSEVDGCWSWRFDSTLGSNYECTATVNTTPRNAADVYYALLVVYAASVPEIVAGPTMMSSGGGP